MSAPVPRSIAYTATVASLALGLFVGNVALPGATSARRASVDAAPVPDAPRVQRYQVPVSRSQPSLGAADALVTLVHFCDLQSAACKQLARTLEQLRKADASELRVVYRHFPPSDQASMLVHELAQIAHVEGGKFWQARDLIMRAERTPDLAELERIAEQIGLDWEQTKKALDKHSYGGHVIADRAFGGMFDVERVPAVFVNGRKLTGEPTLKALRALVREELATARAVLARGVAKDAVYAELVKDGVFRRPTSANP